MAQFEFSVMINRPVEQVFAFTENPANLSLWFVGINEATLVEGAMSWPRGPRYARRALSSASASKRLAQS